MEKATIRPDTRAEIARWISTVIHPMVFPLLTLAVVIEYATHSLRTTTGWVLVAILLTSLPVTLLVVTQVMLGRWTDLDVSVRRQRYLLYPFGLAFMIVLAVVFGRFGAPDIAVRAAVATVIANVADGLINYFYKVSAHTTGAALCAVFLWVTSLAWGMPAAIATLAVGWSRVELKRHTPGQVVLGWLVGVTSAYISLHLPFLAQP